MIEQNLIKPKTKLGLSIFLNSLSKWRNDLENKKINHIKLLQIILDESGYSAMLKNKKDFDNENRPEKLSCVKKYLLVKIPIPYLLKFFMTMNA